jgi:hypothetical protein
MDLPKLRKVSTIPSPRVKPCVMRGTHKPKLEFGWGSCFLLLQILCLRPRISANIWVVFGSSKYYLVTDTFSLVKLFLLVLDTTIQSNYKLVAIIFGKRSYYHSLNKV